MTRVTAGVRIQPGWYRQGSTPTQRRTVTSHATALWSGVAGHMLRMIEAEVKALFKAIGKGFAWRVAAIHALVADRAHRNVRRGELRQVTTRASLVSGKIRPH